MTKRKIYSLVIFTLLLGLATPAYAKQNNSNLIPNPTFENIGLNGDPVDWFRGGYGNNTPYYSFVKCPFYTATDTVHTNPNSFRSACPPDTLYKLEVSVGDYINGDAKWYFADVPVSGNKNYIISYDYQPYIYNAEANVRYTLVDGSYIYEYLGALPQTGALAHGYIIWAKALHKINPPKKALSFTVFFTVVGNGVCGTACYGPSGNRLGIANVVLGRAK
ncbi:MAG: hypothetical protein WAW92_02330 [Minisyncoccia bacterium]